MQPVNKGPVRPILRTHPEGKPPRSSGVSAQKSGEPRVRFNATVRVREAGCDMTGLLPDGKDTDSKDTRSNPNRFRLDTQSRPDLPHSETLHEEAHAFVEWSEQDPLSGNTIEVAGEQFTVHDERVEAARVVSLRSALQPEMAPDGLKILQMLRCKTLHVRIPEQPGIARARSLVVSSISPQSRRVITEKGLQQKLFIWVRPPDNADRGLVDRLRDIATRTDDTRNMFCLDVDHLSESYPSHSSGDLDAALQKFQVWNSAMPDSRQSYQIGGHFFNVGVARREAANRFGQLKTSYAQLADSLALLRSTHPEVLGLSDRVRLALPVLGRRTVALDGGTARDEKNGTVHTGHPYTRDFDEVIYGVQLARNAPESSHKTLAELSEQVIPASGDQGALYFLRRHLLKADHDWDTPGDAESADTKLDTLLDNPEIENFTPLDEPIPPTADSTQPLLPLPPSHPRPMSPTPPAPDPGDESPGDSPCCIVS